MRLMLSALLGALAVLILFLVLPHLLGDGAFDTAPVITPEAQARNTGDGDTPTRFDIFELEPKITVEIGERITPSEPTMKIASPVLPTVASVDAVNGTPDIDMNVPDEWSELPVRVSTQSDNPYNREPLLKSAAMGPYPGRAKNDEIEGVVIVEFTVDKDGFVRNPTVLRARPRGYFEETAERDVKRWVFEPRVVNGVPTEAVLRQTIEYRLDR